MLTSQKAFLFAVSSVVLWRSLLCVWSKEMVANTAGAISEEMIDGRVIDGWREAEVGKDGLQRWTGANMAAFLDKGQIHFPCF